MPHDGLTHSDRLSALHTILNHTPPSRSAYPDYWSPLQRSRLRTYTGAGGQGGAYNFCGQCAGPGANYYCSEQTCVAELCNPDNPVQPACRIDPHGCLPLCNEKIQPILHVQAAPHAGLEDAPNIEDRVPSISGEGRLASGIKVALEHDPPIAVW